MNHDPWQAGVQLFRAGHYFETHEEWEIAWRDARPAERDFYQGMVHVTVALYQAGRDNAQAARSQMRKAKKRLAGYGGSHRPVPHGVELKRLLPEAEQAVEKLLAGNSWEEICSRPAI
jgi:predicted metal-dependent hydrolase